ncbi:hypothetical protein [Bacillus sp. TL12]|uniref:hypothetical protein n=1 Tax=Bacillus sp. TL12 TaxID=2894756 RepID=UPI001F51993C|nr:hypothetical protein [Bacillus sp. TL12]MCI0766479.1 hypothetical protein [Bacillus sp. TL12]
MGKKVLFFGDIGIDDAVALIFTYLADEIGKTDLVNPLLDYYYDFYKKRVPNIQGSPVHDILPLMGIMYDDMFAYYEPEILIAENGTARGQSIGDFRNFFTTENLGGRPRQRVVLNFDYNKFFKEFMTIMK